MTASRSPATRSASVRTCSTSASTTSAATASPTSARWCRGSRAPRRCRSSSTRPSRRSSRRGWSSSAAGPSSTRSTTRTATGPTSRFGRIMPLVKEHGTAVIALTIDEQGQARTADEKMRIASRLVDTLVGEWGLKVSDIIVDCLTFPIATGQEETRRDAIETIEAIRRITAKYPGIHTTLGVSNVSFGLNPAARMVLNSVFLHEAVEAGLDSGIIDAAKIVPLASVPEERRKVALDLVWDRREYDADGNLTYDPLATHARPVRRRRHRGPARSARRRARRAARRRAPRAPHHRRRGEGSRGRPRPRARGRAHRPQIINDHLLEGMKVVGERFGSGEMQLPFVLQSAEVMKTAVALLEPHMEKADASGKGRIVLGDRARRRARHRQEPRRHHPDQQRLRRRQPRHQAADRRHHRRGRGAQRRRHRHVGPAREVDGRDEGEPAGAADARDSPSAGPFILGGAALTRAYVEDDLAGLFDGNVRYARDAFEGLTLMEPLVQIARGADRRTRSGSRRSRSASTRRLQLTLTEPEAMPARSDVASDNPVPAAALLGHPHRARRRARGLFGVPRRARDVHGPVGPEARPRRGRTVVRGARRARGSAAPAVLARPDPRRGHARCLVAYGYFPWCHEGDDLIVLHHGDDPTGLLGPAGLLAPDGGSGGEPGTERLRFHFPRQRRDRHLCLSDFVRSRDSGAVDVMPIQLVTAGAHIDRVTAKLFAANAYRDYYELNGLVMQLTEALAEFWHGRIRSELGFAGEDPSDVAGCSSWSTAGRASRSATPRAPRWRTAARWSSCCAPSGWASS